MQRQFLTTREVAERLGIDVGKVLAWIKSGELKGIDFTEKRAKRPRWRIRISDLEAFLQLRENNPPTPKPVERWRRPKDLPHYFRVTAGVTILAVH